MPYISASTSCSTSMLSGEFRHFLLTNSNGEVNARSSNTSSSLCLRWSCRQNWKCSLASKAPNLHSVADCGYGYDIHPVVGHCYDVDPLVVDMKPKWGCLNHFFCVMQLFSSATTICCQVCFIVSHSHINMVYSVGVVSLKVPIVVFRSFLWFPILFLISPFVGLCLFCVFLVSYPLSIFPSLFLWVFLVSYSSSSLFFSSFRLLPCFSNCAILLFSSLS